MFLFTIPGDPIPQKQTRFARGIAYDPSSKYRKAIEWQMKHYAPKTPLGGALDVDITFVFAVPKSTSGVRKRQMINHVIHHIKKPDADNCAYLITNAMKKIFYDDDSQIIDLHVHKRYGEVAQTVVRITPIHSAEPTQGGRCA